MEKLQIEHPNNKPIKSQHLNSTEKDMFLYVLAIGHANISFIRNVNILSVENLYGIF
jgi:hypothetical protein